MDLSYTITNDTILKKKSVARANPRLVSSDLLITESESEREESQSELEVTAAEESEYEPTFKPLRFGWLLVLSLYKEDYLQIFKCVSF